MNELIQSIFLKQVGIAVDLTSRQELLKNNLDRIFADRGSVEIWDQDAKSHVLHVHKVHTADEFSKYHTIPGISNARYIFISQGHSWSQLQVTAELMLRIIAHHDISPLMIDFVQCYGTKVTGEDNPFYGLFYSSFSSASQATFPSSMDHFDFCFHLRRFENHGNGRMKDPWSLRQMSVYQRFEFSSKTSTWMFIKPFENFQSKLKAFRLGKYHSHPMAPHLLCLTQATENWRWYIDFLRRRLQEFNEKATFCSLDSIHMNYELSVKDGQRLHTLEAKIVTGIAVLEQNLVIGNGLKKHCGQLKQIAGFGPDLATQEWMLDEIETQLAHLSLHKTCCELLLQRVHGTCGMLLKILDLRNVMIMKDYSKVTTELAQIANTQQKNLNVMAQEAKRDSKIMRILTFVAIAYVPGNLIASLFSSDLIRVSDKELSHGSFHVSQDMWIFAVASCTVTIATIVSALLWSQRGN
ncbi:hypothetical protein IQ07DRAFT_585892 [Pyrenochaeta sp. DS3sAY3a]|nr:hypothetical protein IQ07DRAFT_585892 [Pyrenochaeta sp. DS3sAY3a]